VTDVDGVYHNSNTARAHLHVQMCDADVGLWGYLFLGAQAALVVMLIGTMIFHVTGWADNLSRVHSRNLSYAAMGSAGVLVLAFVKSKLFLADDEVRPMRFPSSSSPRALRPCAFARLARAAPPWRVGRAPRLSAWRVLWWMRVALLISAGSWTGGTRARAGDRRGLDPDGAAA
jgi:hypothetical protein